MGLELVEWRDAFFEKDSDVEERTDFIVVTVGWVDDDPVMGGTFVRIVGERTPDNERAITFIPRENVVTRTPLAEVVPVSPSGIQERGTWEIVPGGISEKGPDSR